MIRILILLLFVILAVFIGGNLHAEPLNPNLPADQREQVRQRMAEAGLNFFVDPKQLDDSVGVPFLSGDPDEFRAELAQAKESFGLEPFAGGTFYVMGIAMEDEARLTPVYQQILDDLGYSSVGTRIQLMSVPTAMVKEEGVSLGQRLIERLRYFPFSKKRDHQRPQQGEVVGGLAINGLIEVPNVAVLFSTLPMLDASVTVFNHAVLLVAMTVYTKSTMNWLLRSGTPPGQTSPYLPSETYLKQMSFSAPYVINYQIFAQFTQITDYLSTHTWEQAAQVFGEETLAFVLTQTPTLMIQTLFFSWAITHGFGGWVDRQQGEERVRTARTLRPWLQAPWLAADAVILYLAATNWGEPILQLGPAELNWGHAMLLSLTGATTLMFKKWPNLFNFTIPMYQRVKTRFSRKGNQCSELLQVQFAQSGT